MEVAKWVKFNWEGGAEFGQHVRREQFRFDPLWNELHAWHPLDQYLASSIHLSTVKSRHGGHK